MLDGISRISSTETPDPPAEPTHNPVLSITPDEDAYLTELEIARGD